MPILSRTNNRVLPANARTADVARQSLNSVMPVQARRMDAAFQVNGYEGVLYSYLTAGATCSCQAKGKAINARLDEDGKASPEAINKMLTSSGDFGVRPYAQRPTNTDAYAAQKATGLGFMEVDLSATRSKPVPLASMFDDEDLSASPRFTSGLPDRIDYSESNANASLVVEEDMAEDVSLMVSDFDVHGLSHSDVSCPICFGSGYIGGYSILHGYRKVLNFQDPSLVLPPTAVIAIEEEIPTITSCEATWSIPLMPGISVDALRVWNNTEQVLCGTILIDEVPILSEAQFLQRCDGKFHKVTVRFTEDLVFTHLEVQINQSNFSANFGFPKLSKGSTQSLLEATDPFSVLMSPRVPTVKALDVIVDSTFGKALQVKTVTGQNDRHLTTLGWNVEVRPTQPQELFSMLPRRKPRESINTRSIAIANPNSP